MSTSTDPVLIPPSIIGSDPLPTATTSSGDYSATPPTGSAYNYFFLIIAITGALIFVGLLYFSSVRRRQRKIVRQRNQSSGRNAQTRDIESLGGVRSTPYWGRLGRSNDEILEAGLNERGEAPPDYRHAISGIDKEIALSDIGSRLLTDIARRVNNAANGNQREAEARSGTPIAVGTTSEAETLRFTTTMGGTESMLNGGRINRVVLHDPPRYQELESQPTNAPVPEMSQSPSSTSIRPPPPALLSYVRQNEAGRGRQNQGTRRVNQISSGVEAQMKHNYMRRLFPRK